MLAEMCKILSRVSWERGLFFKKRYEFAQSFNVWLFSFNRKAERAHKEICQAAEEERSMSTQMKELMERGQGKLKQMRRQVEEAVSSPCKPFILPVHNKTDCSYHFK